MQDSDVVSVFFSHVYKAKKRFSTNKTIRYEEERMRGKNRATVFLTVDQICVCSKSRED